MAHRLLNDLLDSPGVLGDKRGNEPNHGAVGRVTSSRPLPIYTQESGNMWLHLPEMSINLAQVLRIIPSADGKIAIVQPDNITVTVDGTNANAVCQLLSTLPAGHLDSWLGRKLQAMQPPGAAPAAT